MERKIVGKSKENNGKIGNDVYYPRKTCIWKGEKEI